MGILTRIRGRKDRRSCAKISPLPSPTNAPIMTNLQSAIEASVKASESRMSFESTPEDASRKRKGIGRIGEKFKRVMLGLFGGNGGGGRRREEVEDTAEMDIPVRESVQVEPLEKEVSDPVMKMHEDIVDSEFQKMLAMLEEGMDVDEIEFSPELLKATDDFVQCCRYQQAGLPYPVSLQHSTHEVIKVKETLIDVMPQLKEEETNSSHVEVSHKDETAEKDADIQPVNVTVSIETNDFQQEDNLLDRICEAYCTPAENDSIDTEQTTCPCADDKESPKFTATKERTSSVESSIESLGLHRMFSNSVSTSAIELGSCGGSEEKLWTSPNGSLSDSSVARHRRLSPKIEQLIELFEGHLLSSDEDLLA